MKNLKERNNFYLVLGIVIFLALILPGWYIGVNYMTEVGNYILCLIDFLIAYTLLMICINKQNKVDTKKQIEEMNKVWENFNNNIKNK